MGVTQILGGDIHSRLVGFHRRGVGLGGRHRLVALLLRDRVLGIKRGVAPPVVEGALRRGGVLGELGARLGQRVLEWRGIDQEQRIALVTIWPSWK